MTWFDATWERVSGKLNAHQPYLKDFLAPDEDTLAAYVYFQLHGEPALSKGGRPRKPPAVNYSSACLDDFLASQFLAPCLVLIFVAPGATFAGAVSSSCWSGRQCETYHGNSGAGQQSARSDPLAHPAPPPSGVAGERAPSACTHASTHTCGPALLPPYLPPSSMTVRRLRTPVRPASRPHRDARTHRS